MHEQSNKKNKREQGRKGWKRKRKEWDNEYECEKVRKDNSVLETMERKGIDGSKRPDGDSRRATHWQRRGTAGPWVQLIREAAHYRHIKDQGSSMIFELVGKENAQGTR